MFHGTYIFRLRSYLALRAKDLPGRISRLQNPWVLLYLASPLDEVPHRLISRTVVYLLPY